MEISVYTPEELKLLMLSAGEDYALIDVSAPQVIELGEISAYERARIPGARYCPLDQLGDQIAEFPRYARLVFSCVDDDVSLMAARQSRCLGFYHAAVLKGGSRAWQQCGFGMERGAVS